jgi:CheY-like chemotaxis protein
MELCNVDTAANPVEPAISPATNSPVILLVEDEAMVRDVTREVLRHAGYHVLECSSAKDALRLASKHEGRIHLLLSDVVMPEMNGPELANRLQKITPGLITVFMSGYGEAEITQKIRCSSTPHLQKPFTVEILLTRISDALQAGLGSPHLTEVGGVSA